MVNTYAVQSGGCRFESLRGFGFCLKGAHYEVDYCGKKTFLAGLQCTLTSSCAKTQKKHCFWKKNVFNANPAKCTTQDDLLTFVGFWSLRNHWDNLCWRTSRVGHCGCQEGEGSEWSGWGVQKMQGRPRARGVAIWRRETLRGYSPYVSLTWPESCPQISCL